MSAMTTIPLAGEVIGPTLLMQDTNLEDQQQQQQEVVIHPPTPRSKPKLSPIATKSLPRRTNSTGLSHNSNTSTEAQQPDSFSTESNSTDCIAQPATSGVDGDFLKVFAAGYRKLGASGGESGCSSDEEEARDSGVVLEPWDQPLLQHQHDQPQQHHGTRSSGEAIPHTPVTTSKPQPPRQPFPSFDQLFQPDLDLLDPQILRRDQKSKRRQRCQSMICPQTPRETELDETESRSDDDTDSDIKDHGTSTLNSDNDTRIQPGPSRSSTASKSDLKATRRSKRVASMSISWDQHRHTFMGAHGLPPLPPLATSTSGTFNTTTTTTARPQRSSFFCSPSLHDSASDNSSNSSGSSTSRDSTARQPSQPPSNDSTGSLSSAFTSSTSTATIPLTRPSSPPDQHHGQFQSLVGSFAHGMPFSNMLDLATAKAENITGLYFVKQMNNQTKGNSMEGSTGQHGKDGQSWKRTRAATSTGSPVVSFSSVPSPADLGKTSTPPTLVQDGARIPGSLLSATTPFTPATTAAATGATSQGEPMTPAKGLHRRSHSASHFFHLSSLKHHSPAQFNLALCYEHGQGGVEQDLTKALYFYQQAADQGHTKASYNLGCICYNQGEISKAMAWFESAGKCGVQGLMADTGILPSLSSSTSAGSVKTANGPILECPLPKATILPHELEDMLMMGDHPSGPESDTGGGGPFVAYLPAILCLALLCRQGVQTREGEVILRRDPDQAVALLQRLLDRAPARMLNNLERGGHHQQSRPQPHQQPSSSSMSASCSSSRMSTSAKRDPRKRASLQVMPTLQQQQHHGVTAAASSSIFSTSCPQLPLGLSSSMSSLSSSCSASTTLAGGGCGSGNVRAKRPSTVEDAVDDDGDHYGSAFPTNESRGNNTTGDPRHSSGSRHRSFLDSEEEHDEEELHGSDVHEAWSVNLAQQLLKAWQQPPQPQPSSVQGRTATTPAPVSMEEGRIQQRIVRHHLLYITNPTLGKNFYNLGVLYDLYLGHAQIAQRCYRSAYQNCRSYLLPSMTPTTIPVQSNGLKQCPVVAGGGAGAGTGSGQAKQLAGLVTRINSAWNLGVLHAKHQEWSRARNWFLKAQQDVLAHERIVAACSLVAGADSVAAEHQNLHRRGSRSGSGSGCKKGMVSDLAALLMKQGGDGGCGGSGGGGGEETAEWSSKVEELLSLGSGGASEMKQKRAAVSKTENGGPNVQEEEEDEFKTRRRSLVNVLPSPAPGGQSNINARGGRDERRGRSGGRDGFNGERGDSLVPKDSPGSHAREHGLMMHLSASSSARSLSSSSSKTMNGGASAVAKSGKKGAASLSSRGGSGEGVSGNSNNGGGSDGIRTDASKVAWVLRWVESNMDSPSSSSLSLSL
ncbi:hypothetical protein EC957_007362 [Mortierella hygrophila]|uniref:Uncharacterized protein n=1 Tax=Mortierella hygrophila TaxID=979708 RepID=A0A9P6JYR3_9FUNG|nr:hypothetical protein EC957_007362 [Mortierella hygrophila]